MTDWGSAALAESAAVASDRGLTGGLANGLDGLNGLDGGPRNARTDALDGSLAGAEAPDGGINASPGLGKDAAVIMVRDLRTHPDGGPQEGGLQEGGLQEGGPQGGSEDGLAKAAGLSEAEALAAANERAQASALAGGEGSAGDAAALANANMAGVSRVGRGVGHENEAAYVGVSVDEVKDAGGKKGAATAKPYAAAPHAATAAPYAAKPHAALGERAVNSARDEAAVFMKEGAQTGAAGGGQAADAAEADALTGGEALLAKGLREGLSRDIVKAGALTLRDGDSGTLKLSLKPESLGNVQIHLEMADNKITGRVILETGEALRAFTREAHALEKAFRDSGYSDAHLEMSLAGDQQSAGQRSGGQSAGNGRDRRQTEGFFDAIAAAGRYDENGSAVTDAGVNGVNDEGINTVKKRVMADLWYSPRMVNVFV
jgi:hypothetical protein